MKKHRNKTDKATEEILHEVGEKIHQEIPLKKIDEKELHHANLRLEIVRMVYRHDKSPADTIERVKELERYIVA